MANFCARCGSKTDEKTGLCPNCDVAEFQEKVTGRTNRVEATGFINKLKRLLKRMLLTILIILIACIFGIFGLVHFNVINAQDIPIINLFLPVSENDSSDKDITESSSENEDSEMDTEAEIAEEVTAAINEANITAANGDWNGALSVLEEARIEFKNNSKLEAAYKDIKDRMPATLETIPMVSSERVSIKQGVVKDRYGSAYDGGTEFSDYIYDNGDAYALYNLSELFTEFSGKLFISPESRIGQEVTVFIYLDDEIAYQQDKVTEETAPLDIVLDVTGKHTMRVVVGNTGSSTAYVDITNSNFKKAE